VDVADPRGSGDVVFRGGLMKFPGCCEAIKDEDWMEGYTTFIPDVATSDGPSGGDDVAA